MEPLESLEEAKTSQILKTTNAYTEEKFMKQRTLLNFINSIAQERDNIQIII